MVWFKCVECGMDFQDYPSRVKKGRKYCSVICSGKNTFIKKGQRLSPNTEIKKGQFKNEKHPKWKGEDAGYSAIHYWAQRHKKRNNQCEWCGKLGYTNFANLDFEYKRDLDTWAELCVSCHKLYDYQNGWGRASEKFEELRVR